MELLGFSLLASRDSTPSSLRATEGEGVLSLRADQETREPKADAHSDFAALLTFLFPSSSPEEGEKSREQCGSTAFGQANHVDTLFPQSPEETFPSSPESVPTHGVSSALSSLLPIIPDQSDTAGILLVNPQKESDVPTGHQQRDVVDASLFQTLALSDPEASVSRPPVENVCSVLLTAQSDQETQTLPLPEPEPEDASVKPQELTSLPAHLPPSLLAMFVCFDATPAPTNAATDAQVSLVASDGVSRITRANDLAPLVPAEDEVQTVIPAGEQAESPPVLPFPPRIREASTADALDSAHIPVLGHGEAAASDIQQLVMPTTQTERTNSVRQPGSRSSPTEDKQVEIYENAPHPTLPLDSSAEVQSHILSRDTHFPETEDVLPRRTRIPVASALPSPGGEALRLSSPGLNGSSFSSPLTQRSTATGVVVIEQVAGEIATRIAQGNKKAVLELEPQELGRVQIDLVLEGERVQIRIVTETAEVSTLIQTHLPELKTALQHHNLELGAVSVDVNARNEERGTFAHDPSQHFGPDNGGNGGGPPTQQQDTESTERRRPSTAPLLPQSGVSVWA